MDVKVGPGYSTFTKNDAEIFSIYSQILGIQRIDPKFKQNEGKQLQTILQTLSVLAGFHDHPGVGDCLHFLVESCQHLARARWIQNGQDPLQLEWTCDENQGGNPEAWNS